MMNPDDCRTYPIEKGFWLSLLDFSPRESVCLRYEKEEPVLNFGFVLSGNYENRIEAPGMRRESLSSHAGSSGIRYLPRQEGRLIIPAETRIRVLHIHLSPPAFFNLFHPDRDSIPGELHHLLDGSADRFYIFRTGMTAATRNTLERLLSGPPPGAPARLFFQGVALDLMACQIARANTRRQSPKGLSLDDRDRVIHARDLLIRDLSSPPCLNQLARAAGLNMNKLQQGFYKLFGVSTFKYLHQHRMQEANRLFHETDMNVSQAATAVGYTNLSHCSNAYKQQFDILPKKHLARIKAGIE